MVFPFRGVNGTGDHHHAPLAASDKDALLLPCFRTLRVDPDTGIQLGGPQPGFNDVVTFSTGTSDAPRREQRRVRWSHGLPNGGQRSNWVALTEFLEGDTYAADSEVLISSDNRGRTRMMCFPSGELPDENGQNVAWMRNEVGGGSPVTGFLDEVFVWRHPQKQALGFVANGENLTEKEKEIVVRAIPPATTLVGTEGYDKDCGVIDLEGELIVYRETRVDGSDSVTLSDCRRGALGTKARAHGTGVPVRFVPNVWVSYIDGNVNKDAASIPLGRTRLWPSEGAARIVGDETVELIHYTGLSPTGLVMPESLDADAAMRGRGLLRGRFGTEAIDHESHEIVVWQPFRYWDRTMIRRGTDKATYVGMHEHPEGSYIEFAKTVRDAVWRRVSWTENLDGRTSGSEDDKRGRDAKKGRSKPSMMDMFVVVRFDQGVPWDSTKVMDLRSDKPMTPDAREHPGKYLFLLDDPEAANRLDVEATTIELRIYFPYLFGAYVGQEQASAEPGDLIFENTWKATPWLRSFSLEYVNRTKVRYNAEIR